VTKPTPAMRQAIAAAPVGDDVFGEDPTVNELQAKAAELLGKEDALFVCSGTMANQLAIMAQTHPGDEIIADRNSHSFNYEGGGVAALSGVTIHTVEGRRGILTVQQISEAIRPLDHHYASTRLICLENTHNRGGGSIYPLEEILRIHELAVERGLLMHLDGATAFGRWSVEACVKSVFWQWQAFMPLSTTFRDSNKTMIMPRRSVGPSIR